MAGAIPSTAVGAGYVLPAGAEREPFVSIQKTLDNYHVCLRAPGATWKEVVADFKDEGYARAFAEWLNARVPK